MTIERVAGDALVAYEELTGLAEDVEDEWMYIQELTAAWQERIDDLIARRGGEAVAASQDAAVGRAAEEVAQISDPHRAIDWLSTFPQVVLIALGERP
jgi:uncharacterized protein YukE